MAGRLGLWSLTLALFALGTGEGVARAEDPVFGVQLNLEPKQLAAGETGVIELEIDFPEGWHLWSLDPGPGPRPLSLALEGDGLSFEGDFYGDPPEAAFDKGFGRELDQYKRAPVHIRRAFRVKDGVAAGALKAELIVRGQICEDQCIDQKVVLPIALEVMKAPTGAAARVLPGEKLSVAAIKVVAPVAASGTVRAQTIDDLTKGGMLSFVLIAFGFGLLALATPCVFPAIPLTISFFSKYSNESFGRGARLAATYAGTIVLAFTGAGVLVSILFGVTGLQRFAAAPLFNILIGGLLIFFALNLLGLFEIQAPQFLLRGVNALEGRFGRAAGAEGAKKSGVADYLVVSVAALTATTVFFTCTVGFVGLVLVAAANGAWFWPTIGLLAFSSAFALPFFLLAMFPQAAQRLRGKGGSWLGATRVTLGFLELAAATKFLSNADLVWQTNLLSREIVLAFCVPLFFLAGFYLLGKIRIGHEHAAAEDGSVSVIQMLASAVMFTLALYLAAGLFANRNFGGWIDGWLPPLTATPGMAGGSSAGTALAFLESRAEAQPIAEREGKLVFVNYTGITCTNCRYMEGGMFPRAEIAPLLDRMVRVELYTDRDTQETDDNRDDQVARFQTAALPFYAVERADGSVVATFPSSTNDPKEFERFLKDALAAGAGKVPSRVVEAAKAPFVKAGRLADRKPAEAIELGKWNLVNFWATWCGPCREELTEFMVVMGKDLDARGGRFITIAVEDEDTIADALAFMNKLGVAADRALAVPSEGTSAAIDTRLGFGGSLPYTVLVSPAGEVVWKHDGRLSKDALRAVLVEHTGFALLR